MIKTAVIFLATAAFVLPVHAEQASNGLARNGVTPNGLSRNGVAINGMKQNGFVVNGMRQNGLRANGTGNAASHFAIETLELPR